MKIQRPKFKLITEPVKTKKIAEIKRVCHMAKNEIGKDSSLLEHVDSVFEVTPGLYTTIRDTIALWTGEADLAKNINHPKSYLRLTKVRLENGKNRYLVSGTFQAWYDFADYLHTDFLYNYNISNTLTEIFPIINRSMDGMLDRVLNNQTQTVDGDSIREITDFSELTEEERMVHERISVQFTCSRKIAQGLAGRREISITMEDFTHNAEEVSFICPASIEETDLETRGLSAYQIWKKSCEVSACFYQKLLDNGVPFEEAAQVLPESRKTNIIVTANLTEWKHLFEQGTCDDKNELTKLLLLKLRPKWNFAFRSLEPVWNK